MTINDLKQLLESGEFHHATYRNQGTLWEGLWIYRKDPEGYQGYSPAGCFNASSPDCDAAHDICSGTGISLGSYVNDRA